jgi:hypothetical protein
MSWPSFVATQRGDAFFEDILPFDVGYHSPKPMFEGHESMDGACSTLDGKPCYYEGGGLRAIEWAKRIFGADVRGDIVPPKTCCGDCLSENTLIASRARRTTTRDRLEMIGSSLLGGAQTG